MTPDGIELCRLFERPSPDGGTMLIGMLGDAGIAIVRDPTRPGTWRVILTDPTAAARPSRQPAITAPVDDDLVDGDDWSLDDNTIMDDTVPADCMALPTHGGER